MSIYQLKSRAHYIEKSFECEHFRENIFSEMKPGINIFLIDEHFDIISVITKSHVHLASVNIYEPIKGDYDKSTILKFRNFYQMTIAHGKIGTRHSNDFPEVIIRKFLNCYLDSEQVSRKIKRIRDKMSFLKYAIEYEKVFKWKYMKILIKE